MTMVPPSAASKLQQTPSPAGSSHRQFVSTGVQTDAATIAEPTTARMLASQPRTQDKTRPHTIIVLCISLALVWISSIVPTTKFSNQTKGFFASISLFSIFATLQFPDGALVRPHPAVWRFVKGVSILYLCLICFLLFQDVATVRAWLKQIDPSLGPIVEKDYAGDCRLITWDNPVSIFANVKSRLDVFVVAHLCGWLVKALIIRDSRLLWIMSFLFEWMEITFRHKLPNFWECWWDHFLLDVFGCNMIGIWLGMRLVKWFEMEDYNWRRIRKNSNAQPRHKQSTSVQQTLSSDNKKRPLCSCVSTLSQYLELLTPFQWTVYQWPYVFSSYEAFFGLTLFVFGVTFLDLNLFFLKAQLGLEPSHWILLLRTALFILVSASGTRDLYEFFVAKRGSRLGVQGWLGAAIILSELMLAVKYWDALPVGDPCPTYVKVVWATFFVFTFVTGLWLFFYPPKTEIDEQSETSQMGSAGEDEATETAMHVTRLSGQGQKIRRRNS